MTSFRIRESATRPHLCGNLKVFADSVDTPSNEVEKAEIVGAVPVLPGKTDLAGGH